MWLMLTTGALSVVQRDPKTMTEGDTRTLVVRARRKEYLDSFRGKYCPQLTESVHIDKCDYQWRGYIAPDDLAVAVARAVLSIDYRNFKAATQSPQHGLPDAGLRNGLHDAYSKCWTALLNAGDGTSAYDWKGICTTGIEACYRWGHWWPAGEKDCKDCGEPNPSYPEAGPEHAYPERPVKAVKGKVPRKRKARKQASAKAYSQDVLKGSEGCEGSWKEPDADTVAFPTAYNGYQETAVCWFCGERVQLTPDGLLKLHWEGVAA